MGREETRAVERAAVERRRARESGAGKRKKRKRDEATDPCAEKESRRKKNRSEKSEFGVDGMLPDASREYAVEDAGGEEGEAPDRGVDDRLKNKKLDRPADSKSPVGESSRSRKKKKKNVGCGADADAIDAGSSASRRDEDNLNSLETGAEKKEKEEEKKKAGRRADGDAIDAGPSAPRGEDDNLNSLKTSGEKKEKKKKKKEKEEEEEKEKKKEKEEKRKKKVRFSDHNHVYNISESAVDAGDEVELVVGKWYSEEENKILMDAIAQCLKGRGLGEDDTHMLFNVKKHREVRGCWKEIYAAIPWRPSSSVYIHADLLLHQSQKRSWTAEEIELLKKYRKEHGKGCRWQGLSEHLGRYRHHMKDAWRRNRLPNVKKGKWSQGEYQQLFDLVNMDLRMKSAVKEESRNKMLRQNISWMAISDKLATRDHVLCCLKWYNQLASPMVAKGLWKDTDDYLLLNALSELDASCTEDVDWDSLLGNRSGEVCRQRWKEMIKHIVGKKERSFAEQVEILSRRYCPDMIQYMAEGAKTQ